MASNDYGRVMQLPFRDHKRVEKIEVTLGQQTDSSTLTFADGSTFQSAVVRVGFPSATREARRYKCASR
jgi:hypothetical protein